MAAIQIGKYRRPGIFFEEFDLSIIPPPPAPAPLASSLVVGFSKKGPINTPILISNVDELERIYGPLDRTLERKGSYFHRTIAKILETSPVLAMNLLPTSDTLDKIQYRSLSTATDKANSSVIEIPLRKIHDTSSFWIRDNETFIDNIKDEVDGAQRLFHVTNISNRYVSLFIFKSKITGFNQSLVEYYGTADKTPPYLNPLDFASDYMVDVLAVSGDWSNYNDLSVDIKWSAYFNSNGLKKDAYRAFAQDRNVNTLALYEGCSLIPFFRNSDGKNVFIETVINNDTDKTGLFCAFNADKLENAYRNDMVDLNGNNLVRNNSLIDFEQDTVDFLSYTAKITEKNPFGIVPLDNADGVQAVMALGASISAFSPGSTLLTNNTRTNEWYNYSSSFEGPRTTYFANEIIRGVRFASASSRYIAGVHGMGVTHSLTIGFDVARKNSILLGTLTASSPYFVVNGQKKFVDGAPDVAQFSTFTFSYYHKDFSAYSSTGPTVSLFSVFYLNGNTGRIEDKVGSVSLGTPRLNDNDVVLGMLKFDIVRGGLGSGAQGQGGYFTSSQWLPIGVTGINVGIAGNEIGFTASFTEIISGTDYTITELSAGKVRFTLLNTAVYGNSNGGEFATSSGPFMFGNSFGFTNNPYSSFRKIRWFNYLVNLLSTDEKKKMVLLEDVGFTSNLNKISLANAEISNIITNTGTNRSFDLDLKLATTPLSLKQGNIVIYKVDNEFYTGTDGFDTRTTRGSMTMGVAGKYSDAYLGFINGKINTGDYFYKNFYSATQSINLDGVTTLQNYGAQLGVHRVLFSNTITGQPAIVFQVTNGGGVNTALPFPIGGTESFYIPDSVLNDKIFTFKGVATSPIIDPITGTSVDLRGGSLATASAWLLDKSVVTEDLRGVRQILDANRRVYLRGFTDPSGNLFVNYRNSDLTTLNSATQASDFKPIMISDLGSLKQTVEIFEPAGYTPVDNKILIRGDRATTVRKGDFLQAKVNTDNLVTGETGRKITRILSKRSWSVDPTYTEITCDSSIQKYLFENGYMQTLAYTTLDDYVDAYKAIKLKGFKTRDESIPNGTEETQQSILNMVAKGTPLFKALVNKDSIDFRYVVDSFGLGLIEDSKQQLVDIVGERLDCFGFINMPSMRYFKNSKNPSFTNTDGTINTQYIAAGGNREANPKFLYSFGKGKGVSAVGYFLPYLVVNDNGRPAELPPAMFVANTYLKKITGANPAVLPWTIAAGVNNGRILNIRGVEQNFSFEDIENLNLAQMNPIVFKKNAGFTIETENTAQVIYQSALSYIHVREVLIELERELTAMLLDYQWKFNTPEIRAEIKLKADAICEKYVNKNGLYNYFNKCDDENNTPDLIDRQIGVIDTFVEPIKGMGIIVNNITILRTGAIEAGGFL